MAFPRISTRLPGPPSPSAPPDPPSPCPTKCWLEMSVLECGPFGKRKTMSRCLGSLPSLKWTYHQTSHSTHTRTHAHTYFMHRHICRRSRKQSYTTLSTIATQCHYSHSSTKTSSQIPIHTADVSTHKPDTKAHSYITHIHSAKTH